MKWLKNLENLASEGIVGECPYCHSTDTEHRYVLLKNTRVGYGDIWCNNCKHGYHLSRVIVSDDMISSKQSQIPDDIQY